MTRVLRLLLAVAGVCSAQMFEIRGTVTEPGLGGIAGAEITIYSQNAGNRQTEILNQLKTYTNARGEFGVRVPTAGRYSAGASLNGYFLSHSSVVSGSVTLDQPVAQVRLEMFRFAEMTGRVVDADTHEPVRGITVQPVRRESLLDGRSWSPAIVNSIPMNPVAEEARKALVDRLLTDANGVFRFTGLPPGAYAAAVADLQAGGGNTKYSADEAKVVDAEYEHVYWPGGLPPAETRPTEVGSGGVFNVGEIRLKKVPFYRVHVRIPQGDCPEGESVRVSVLRRNLAPQSVGVFPCGSDALLRGFEPGSYTLYAVSDWQGERDNLEGAVWATASFSIGKENVEATLDLRRGAVMKGRIVGAEGVTDLPKNLPLVAVRPAEIVEGSRPPSEQFIEWNENGTFRLASGFGQQEIFLGTRVLKEGYISRVFYNGSPSRGLTIDVKPGEKQDLEVVIDNKFGTLEGTAEGAAGLAVWWSSDDMPTPYPLRPDGSIRIDLPPGEYRIAAMENSMFPSAGSAQKVVLKPGEVARVVVKRRTGAQ